MPVQPSKINAHYRLYSRTMAEPKTEPKTEPKADVTGEYVNEIKSTVGALMKWVCIRVNCRHHTNDDSPAGGADLPTCREGRHHNRHDSLKRHRLRRATVSQKDMDNRQHCVLALNKHSDYFSLDLTPGANSMPSTEIPRAGMRSVISDGSSTPSSPDVRHSNSTTLHHSHQHHHQQCTPCGTPAQTPGHRRTSGSMSSMASSTMRPRSGREYVDRRKLDELNLNGSDDQVAPSPFSNTSSVFTFDSSMSLSLSNCSPRSPSESSYMSSRTKEPEYVNINPFTPPASPHHSIGSEVSNRRLNYAEIDLSSSGNTNSSSDRPTSRVIPSRPRGSDVHYAKIDMVAMAAASRVGREHAQFREDSLKRKDDPRRVPEDRFHHRHKTLTNSKRLSITNRSGSKDRKHSAPS